MYDMLDIILAFAGVMTVLGIIGLIVFIVALCKAAANGDDAAGDR